MSSNDIDLEGFADYIIRNRLAPEKNAPYIVRWVRKFLGEAPQDVTMPLSDRVNAFICNFLAHLATRLRLGASTQNQAFNAVLFAAREVLHVDLGDLQPGVRAKRGTRLGARECR